MLLSFIRTIAAYSSCAAVHTGGDVNVAQPVRCAKHSAFGSSPRCWSGSNSMSVHLIKDLSVLPVWSSPPLRCHASCVILVQAEGCI